MLVTALLASGVGDLVDVIVPDHLLEEEVMALCQAKPPEEVQDGNSLPLKPERRLRVAEHEGLDLGIIKDGGLVLQLNIVLLLHHAVET